MHLPVPVLSRQIQHGSVTRLAVLPTVRRALGRRTRMSSPCGPAVGLGPLWSPSALGIGLGQDAGCRSRVGDLVPDEVVRRTMERLGRGHRQSEPGRGRRFVAVVRGYLEMCRGRHEPGDAVRYEYRARSGERSARADAITRSTARQQHQSPIGQLGRWGFVRSCRSVVAVVIRRPPT